MGQKKLELAILIWISFLWLYPLPEIDAFRRYYCEIDYLHKACAYQAPYKSSDFRYLWHCCYISETDQLTCSKYCDNGHRFIGRIYSRDGTESSVTSTSTTSTPESTTSLDYWDWPYDSDSNNRVSHHDYFPSIHANTIAIIAGSVVGSLVLVFCVIGIVLCRRSQRLARSLSSADMEAYSVRNDQRNNTESDAAPSYESLQLTRETREINPPEPPASEPLTTEPPTYAEVMAAAGRRGQVNRQ